MRIREIISKQGISTKDVADKLGITLSALNQNISGNPSVKVLNKIAEVLNVPIWELFVSPEDITNDFKGELLALINYQGDFYKATTLKELEEIVDKIRGKK